MQNKFLYTKYFYWSKKLNSTLTVTAYKTSQKSLLYGSILRFNLNPRCSGLADHIKIHLISFLFLFDVLFLEETANFLEYSIYDVDNE